MKIYILGIILFAFTGIPGFCQTDDTVKYNMMISGKRNQIATEISRSNVQMNQLYKEFKVVREYDSLLRLTDSLHNELNKLKFKPFQKTDIWKDVNKELDYYKSKGYKFQMDWFYTGDTHNVYTAVMSNGNHVVTGMADTKVQAVINCLKKLKK